MNILFTGTIFFLYLSTLVSSYDSCSHWTITRFLKIISRNPNSGLGSMIFNTRMNFYELSGFINKCSYNTNVFI